MEVVLGDHAVDILGHGGEEIVDDDAHGGKGGDGGVELANKVLETLETKESFFEPIYKDELSLKEKIETIAKEIYGAKDVIYEPAAEREIKNITEILTDILHRFRSRADNFF